jgi:uncharacterized protein with HEPN domain
LDIVQAIARIRDEVDGVSLDAFKADWRKRWLVERGVEIISEASRHLGDELKSRDPEIPWRRIAGVGNVLRHEYDRVAPDVLWKLGQGELPLLDEVCRKELSAEEVRGRGGG